MVSRAAIAQPGVGAYCSVLPAGVFLRHRKAHANRCIDQDGERDAGEIEAHGEARLCLGQSWNMIREQMCDSLTV